MRIRDLSNHDICSENGLPYDLLTNVVEETSAKNRMRATSNIIAKSLIATLGPYGTNTIIQDRDTHHFATKDGYSLINKMTFQDDVSRTILDILRTSASNQVLTVGDGSTSAIVVANALFQNLTDPQRREEFKKLAPKDIMDILNDISDKVEDALKEMATPISEDMHELDTIAAIANNNDTSAGKTIAEIYRKIGEHGFITIDEIERKDHDEYEVKSGVEWERGWVDPFFDKFAEDGKIEYRDMPKVFISKSCITYDDLQTVLMPIMVEAFNQEDQKLLIIANDFDEDAVAFLRNNRMKHRALGQRSIEMDFVAVDIDNVVQESRNKLDDLAILCNCKIYDKLFTKPAEIVARPKDFVGRAAKIVVTRKNTQVVGLERKDMGAEHVKKLDEKIKELSTKIDKLQKKEQPSNQDAKEMYELRKRYSRLTSSSAVLHVGGKTLAERMSRKALIEDAVLACKSALKYGYLVGGNISVPKYLLDKKEGLADYLGTKYSYLNIDMPRVFFLHFIDVIASSFLESYRAVLNNAYFTEEEVENILTTCVTESKFYNLKKHEYENMTDTNVINSVDTDIQILRTSISIVGLLSTSNQMLTINLDVDSHIKK